MIIAKIKGGFGNQMFQYAMAKRLSMVSEAVLKLDIGASPQLFQKNTDRSYDLDKFNISASIATQEEVKKIKYPYGIFSTVRRRFQFWVLKKYNIEFDEKYMKPIDRNKNIYLDGFWQSYKYFDDIRDTLLKEFTPKELLSPESVKIIQKISSTKYPVSLNVRRGDYVLDPETQKVHGSICDAEYYKNAISKMKERVGEFELFVVSDDIPWVKENLNFGHITHYVSNPNTIPYYEEITIIKACNGHILANSSFGWWGAWLNEKNDKIVIVPGKWTRDPNSHRDIVPPDWIRV